MTHPDSCNINNGYGAECNCGGEKKLVKKISKVCGTPEDFCFEYVSGSASIEEGIRRMKEYVRCVNKVERATKKKPKK